MTPIYRGGLEGIVAGKTRLSTVGVDGFGLTYLGYSIEDLAANAGFEEVAYLLLYGELPKANELASFLVRLSTVAVFRSHCEWYLSNCPRLRTRWMYSELGAPYWAH